MTQTLVLYVLTLFIVYLLARKARMTNDKISLMLIIVILSLLVGLRGETVGIDTSTYVRYFHLIGNGRFNYVWGVEYTFKIIMLVVSQIFGSYTVLFLLIAILTNICIVMRLWDFRDISNFEWVVVTYYIGFYFYEFNIMRQMCAIAVVFWASRYIEKGKYLRFIAGIAIACIFHKSALLGVIFLISEIVNWKFLNKWQQRTICAASLCVPIGVLYLFRELSSYFRYFSSFKIRLGPILLLKVMLFILSQWNLRNAIVSHKLQSVAMNRNEVVRKLNYKIRAIEAMYFIGLILAFAGYANKTVSRIALYPYILECVYYGMLMKYKKIRSGYPIIIVLLLGYLFINALIKGGQGQNPYLFFWQ